MINVYIDNNVWDFLFARRIDLAVALPSDRFCLYIPREVEFEIPTAPEKADPDEADTSLAARATRYVLSNDKRGPLDDTYQRGGKVVSLTETSATPLWLSCPMMGILLRRSDP